MFFLIANGKYIFAKLNEKWNKRKLKQKIQRYDQK